MTDRPMAAVDRRPRRSHSPRRSAAALATVLVVALGVFTGTPGVLAPAAAAKKATPGFVLYSAIATPGTYLIDKAGKVVHSWQAETPVVAAYLLENGNLLRTTSVPNPAPFLAGGQTGRVEEVAWNGSVIWRFEYASDRSLLHHDVEKLPNGNVLVAAWERKTAAEAIAAGRAPDLLAAGQVWSDALLEYSPATRSVVWEWHAWDHLVQDRDPSKPNYGVVSEKPGRIDLNYVGDPSPSWLHFNGLDYDAARDEIVVSSRQFSEVWIVEHSESSAAAAGPAGDLRFRWGNPAAYQRGDASDRQLFFQHDPQWTAKGLKGAGALTVFNNGARGARESTTIEQIKPVREQGVYQTDRDGRYLPAKATRVLPTRRTDDSGRFFSEIVGSAQRLPTGGLLVADAQSGRILETDVRGKVVWEYQNPYHAVGDDAPTTAPNGIVLYPERVFHAHWLPADYRGLVGRGVGGATVKEGPKY